MWVLVGEGWGGMVWYGNGTEWNGIGDGTGDGVRREVWMRGRTRWLGGGFRDMGGGLKMGEGENEREDMRGRV